MKRFAQLSAAATLLAAAAGTMQAQATAVAFVSVNAIVSSSLAASTVNSLSFGTVVQGSAATTIDPNTNAAGEVSISGTNSQGISITMTTLPATLVNGAATLGVSGYKYCYTTSTALQASCTPTATTTGGSVTGLNLSTGGQGFLYLGATLAAPSVSQTTGTYTANMTITITSP
ncbi:MAG TPA: hypothetical protein VMH39_02370 [Gemmatimonadaceae bacterium]|nr:hypothetical protein [Gemmatimonadaceae bacterium]